MVDKRKMTHMVNVTPLHKMADRLLDPEGLKQLPEGFGRMLGGGEAETENVEGKKAAPSFNKEAVKEEDGE